MKKALLGVVAVIMGAVVVALPMHGAQAYPDVVCTIEAPSSVQPGDEFEVVVRSSTPQDLSVSFDGRTASRPSATTLAATFRAPTSGSTAAIEARCGDEVASATLSIGAGAGSGSGAGEPDARAGGLLPDTGGAPFWLLVSGVVLAVVGGTIVIRRRQA